MSHKGMNGHMGCASDDFPITIELIEIWNELGVMCSFVHSYEEKLPEHLSKLQDAISSVRDHLKDNPSEIKYARATFFEGNNELWDENHREESERLQRILIGKGFLSCGIRDAEGLWRVYSDTYCTDWLIMAESDEEIYDFIKDQLVIIKKKYIG